MLGENSITTEAGSDGVVAVRQVLRGLRDLRGGISSEAFWGWRTHEKNPSGGHT